MRITDDSRRLFLGFFSGIGLGGTLLPGVLWAQIQQEGAQRITQPMLADALALSGLTFSDEDQRGLLQAANQNLTRGAIMKDDQPIKPLWLTEKDAILQALAVVGQDISRAAALLEVSPSTLYRKLQSWRLEDVPLAAI